MVDAHARLDVSEAGRQRQERTLGEHLAHWAAQAPDAPAITFQDFLQDPAGESETLTYAQLDARVDAMATLLLQDAEPGDRVAILAPQSMAYVVSFIACVRVGLVAVPLFSPDLPGHGDRLASIFVDCDPMLALATEGNQGVVEEFLRSQPGGASVRVVVVDGEVPEPTEPLARPQHRTADVAYLQYTSGSTRRPAGVLITQGNIVANTAQALGALHAEPQRDTFVSWLPLFHDMGLVLAIGGSVVGGMHAVVMDPIAFLVDPSRWLRALADHPRTLSFAPNFAFAYAASKVGDEAKASLDLSDVRFLGNGAEPVRPETLDAFHDAFEPCGLPPHTVRPVYGLAEATVYVSGGSAPHGTAQPPVLEVRADVEQLSRGALTTDVGAGAPTQRMVSVGTSHDQHVVVVDPETGRRRADGEVGEIWIHGPNVSPGYWESPERSAEVFGQVLVDADDLPAEPWMRTGDLGVVHDGELFITGRIKDLIIVGGRNHYPQDLESTVESADRVVGRHRTAAFSVATDDGEQVVVVAEVSRHAEPGSWDGEEVARTVAEAVSRRHSVALRDVVLVEPNRVPRTSSGKIARSATRDLYLQGALEPVGAPA